MTAKSPVQIEKCKESLQDYLINKVLRRLSGKDCSDIVRSPSQSIFAGVLKARFVRPDGSENIQEKQQTSSLGFDFRMKPTQVGGSIKLSINAKWCFYYSVFPSCETTQRDNVVFKKDNSSGKHRDVVLPVIFRRKEVEATEKNIEISYNTLSPTVYNLDSDVSDAKNTIDADTDRWCHLGDPKQQIRSIGSTADIKDDKDYYNRLSEIKNHCSIQTLPDWRVDLYVETDSDILDPDIYRIKVLLSNETIAWDDSVEDKSLDERAIFDAMIEVQIEGGEVIPFEFLLAERDYRSKPEMIAKGINCVVQKDVSNQILRSETLPIYEQPLDRTKQDSEVKFESLDIDDPASKLTQIADSMRSYIEEWDLYLKGSAKNELSASEMDRCNEDRKNFEREINSYLLGIECLRQDKLLKRAFQLMNGVFYRLGQKSGGKIEAWRLFQICFIISQLPSLMVRELTDSHEKNFKNDVIQEFERVTVLWFPTGGGKTEAYLGLIATALLFDRLRGKTHGVNTWMRFPLRMLSLQQMERLAKVIAELNILRDEEKDIQQGDPFSIGYYVGNAVTPNSVSEKDMDYYESREQNRKKILILRKCPYCNAKAEIQTDRTQWRILHKCTNEKCFSYSAHSLGLLKGSLPLYIVDKEIYRYLPSVLVGTVDKLAIVGFNKGFSQLIKGVSQKCPEHGFTSYDECLESNTSGCTKKKRSALDKLDSIKDPGPSLLIQDEFHLLKADLGVFNGHYEGFLQYVGQKVYLPPKVLAATATIEKYDNQAFHLYLKEADRFPQPSWKRRESFYTTSTPFMVRRKYIGVLCHSKAIDDAASRLIFLYQHEIRLLKADFNKAKKAFNNQALSDNEISDILTLYDLSLAYVNRKATGSNLLYKLDFKSGDFEYEGLRKLDHDLLTGDRNPDEIGATLERIEIERKETGDPRLDVVAATSLISHGVDLERINMMTICGMPSHYAEYVQSSSRAARSHPGLVFACFLSKDAREVSQYEMFMPMHENIDSLIEPVAVNRFASFAPNKTVPGLLSALLINDLSPELYRSDLGKSLTHVPTVKVALGLQSTGSSTTTLKCIRVDELLTALEQIIGIDRYWPKVSKKEIENIKVRLSEILQDQIALIGRSPETNLTDVLKPITSFRDVDQGLEFYSLNSPSLVTRISGR
ncbi:MAG: hypothetical protein GY941_05350 [Planctomycetes bacterium]|nr:hypothetical protein [Planctomycetota bacterium]